MRRAGLILLIAVTACVTSETADPTSIATIATTTIATTATTAPTTTEAAAPDRIAETTSATAAPTTTTVPLAPLVGLEVELVAEVHRPVVALAVPNTSDLFVVDQAGRIMLVAANGDVAEFLNLTDRVGASGIEQGLLGNGTAPGLRIERALLCVLHRSHKRQSPRGVRGEWQPGRPGFSQGASLCCAANRTTQRWHPGLRTRWVPVAESRRGRGGERQRPVPRHTARFDLAQSM